VTVVLVAANSTTTNTINTTTSDNNNNYNTDAMPIFAMLLSWNCHCKVHRLM